MLRARFLHLIMSHAWASVRVCACVCVCVRVRVYVCVWQSTPRTADVTVTEIAGYVRVRILMNRWFFRIFRIHRFYVSVTFYTPGAYALTRSKAMQRPRAVHACGSLRLVGECIRRHNNVGGVTAGQAPHNSRNVGVVTAGQVGHNSSIHNPTKLWQYILSIIYPVGLWSFLRTRD